MPGRLKPPPERELPVSQMPTARVVQVPPGSRGYLGADSSGPGFAVESLTRREPYPGAEVATPRAYLLARAV